MAADDDGERDEQVTEDDQADAVWDDGVAESVRRAPTGRAPTIRDVARAAGVSKSLVSLVLREDPSVSVERRTAVLRAMKDMGYEPNRIARALAGNGSGAIGVLVNDISNPWYVDILDGLSKELEPAGVAPLVVDSSTNQRVGRSSIQILTRQRVDGIIVVGTSGEEADVAEGAGQTPVVLAGTYDPASIGADVVANDDAAGARRATEHLLGLGHRRIAHLRGPQRVGELREEGYREAMTRAGLETEISVAGAGMSEQGGRDATMWLLRHDRHPTAIVAYNDLAAVGALAAADDLGLSSPHDLSVVGYDDTYIAGLRRISLTTIENGSFAIGAMAARYLLERIGGYDGERRELTIPSSLVVRGTTAPPPPSSR